ncbi:hypothetical protein SAMN05660691_03451 [Rheinheimera pacifica]|uniref:Uncharacterized protein n=1 Tax=Rheinheimera pacifica TaxID=173990 RepID=A0A1H6N7A2_9GAMM|nr:hypothetical protein [Rheinheimera pacifica]SEI08244.1 hypothetical protein SAMN05660691_03451 [Rheinheimera pacifica]
MTINQTRCTETSNSLLLNLPAQASGFPIEVMKIVSGHPAKTNVLQVLDSERLPVTKSVRANVCKGDMNRTGKFGGGFV